MGWTVSTMAWGILDGYQLLSKQTYDGQSNLAWALETLEYGLRFLLDCSYDDGEFVAQVRHLEYSPGNYCLYCLCGICTAFWRAMTQV